MMLPSYKYKQNEDIENHIRDRKIIQWLPSRDWSRLFVLSKRNNEGFYLELYNFNIEKQSILPFPSRINNLSQLIRPLLIQSIPGGPMHENYIAAVSFAGDRIAIKIDNEQHQTIEIYDFNPNCTIARQMTVYVGEDEFINSFTLFNQKLIFIEDNGLHLECQTQIIEKTTEIIKEKECRQTEIKRIIQCGIYDILVNDKTVKIFSNINPSNELKETKVDKDFLALLKQQKFIQIDDHSIVCLVHPLQGDRSRIKIIDISNQNLMFRETREKIQVQAPQNKEFSDCEFDLIKFVEYVYAAFIVTSTSQGERFLQIYGFRGTSVYESSGSGGDSGWNQYTLQFSKRYSDCLILQQIPHLPYLTIDGRLFINDEKKHNNIYQELDILLDECEIIYQDEENIYDQFQVYNSLFKETFFKFIEEKEIIINSYKDTAYEFHSIEIPELNASVNIIQHAIDEQIIGLSIFQPSVKNIKHLNLKVPMRYMTHNVFCRDSSYYASIILQTKHKELIEVRFAFDLTGVTLTPFKPILKLEESQRLHHLHLSSNLVLTLLLTDYKYQSLEDASGSVFTQYSWSSKDNIWYEQGETIIFNIEKGKGQASVPQVSSIIQRVAQTESLKINEDPFLKYFESIIYQNTEFVIKDQDNRSYPYVLTFQNKIILFEKGKENLTILDDSLSVISTISLKLKSPLKNIRIVSTIDSCVIEYIDEFNNKLPIPISASLQDSESYIKQLDKYSKDFRYPMPFQFAFHDDFISDLDLNSVKLLFYKSQQDKRDGNPSTRIEIISEKESFIDVIRNAKDRKTIENEINKTEMNILLSYNINKRMNLITGTKQHVERDHIYRLFYEKLEIADIDKLPMLIYNTSSDSNRYESIIDILVENKAIKLAQLIVRRAIQQDQIGYVYNRLGPYLSIISANELQLFLDSQIFFFKISTNCYEEYQIKEVPQISPNSEYHTFAGIEKNIKLIESSMLPIEIRKVTEIAQKNSDNPEDYKEGNHLQKSEKNAIDKNDLVPIEYFVINLMQFNKSKRQPRKENHRVVTKILNQLVETDQTILEKESIQIIIDYKWVEYARYFFSIQLVFFICFIIAFIVDIVAVSKNNKFFEAKDSHQVIPRIISIAILILFAIYEIFDISVGTKRFFTSFWNIIDLLLIFVYGTYFIISFAQPEQEYTLKSLQLLIVIFCFIKLSFLIRIWTQLSFLVRMVFVVFQELLLFLFYFLLVIAFLTVMAQIIISQSGESYQGIEVASYFVIVLRQAIGDYDTASIIEGTRDFKILAWLLWLIILIIGNIVFMNFIIAVVSQSYENCQEQKVMLIYRAKLEMIEECEDLMPDKFFEITNLFPKFIIIRRQQGSSRGGENSDQWQGFVKQIKRHLDHETTKLKNIFTQNINRSKKDSEEVKTGLAEMREEINEIKEILSVVYKDQIVAVNAQKVLDAKKKTI